MKLGSLVENEKLSLDMTPLIDIVFLLVLFFAVSTSFISPEHLDELKKSLLTYKHKSDELTQSNLALSTRVNSLQASESEQKNALARLQTDLSATQQSAQQKSQLLADRANTMAAQVQKIAHTTQSLAQQDLRVSEQQQVIQQQADVAAEQAQTIQSLNERIIIDTENQQRTLTDFQKLLAVSKVKETALRQEIETETARAERLREALDAEQEQAKKTIAQLDVGLRDLVANEQLGVKQVQNRVVIQLPDNVLFDSGSADIKAQGLIVLNQVGQLLKAKAGGMSIQVGGHTDNVPLGADNQKIYHDNWGLSSYRAVNVVRFFQQQVGISSQKLSAAGYGFYRPIAKNTTLKGRKLNRRIEIVLLPE